MVEPHRPQIDVSKIPDEPPGAPDVPDSETEKEQQDLENQERQARLRGLIQDIGERKRYAKRIFYLVSLWLAGVFILLIFQCFLSPWHVFALSDNVLMAAIGGTTINVIGIFVVVARYLFPRRDANERSKRP